MMRSQRSLLVEANQRRFADPTFRKRLVDWFRVQWDSGNYVGAVELSNKFKLDRGRARQLVNDIPPWRIRDDRSIPAERITRFAEKVKVVTLARKLGISPGYVRSTIGAMEYLVRNGADRVFYTDLLSWHAGRNNAKTMVTAAAIGEWIDGLAVIADAPARAAAAKARQLDEFVDHALQVAERYWSSDAADRVHFAGIELELP